MGRKKKMPPIEGVGRNPENLLVQKSRPIASLWMTDLTLSEFKILDTYLSRINSRNPDQREVVLEKGKLEELIGVRRINREDLEDRLTHLQKTVVPVKRDGKNIDNITLFERSIATQDEFGRWNVTLMCTPSAMKYMFNIETIGYLRYRVRSIANIKSRYSYLLFMHLELNRFRLSWETDLEELKMQLGCHQDESYKQFKVFNDRILKRCQKELEEKTECRFAYEPIRKGRSVAKIRFTLESLAPKIEAEINDGASDEPVQLTIEEHELRAKREAICAGFDDRIFDEFTDEQLIELKNLAWGKEDPDEVERQDCILHNTRIATEYAVSKLIREKILAMNVYAKREPIGDRYAYLKTAVKKHSPKTKAKESQGSFDTQDFFAAAVRHSLGEDIAPDEMN